MQKTIQNLIPAYDVDMGGVKIKQALPTQQVNQVDPFLLLHHGRFPATADAPARQQGLGPHPHRGFSPVTFVIEGEVHHRDSRGHNQIAKQGEVQWMHAGRGIIHSERPSEALARRSGIQEVIQLWINSPASKKMEQPNYQFVPEPEIPVIISDDQKVRSKLIAGEMNGNRGKIQTESELLVVWGRAEEGGITNYGIPANFNAMLYVIRGKVKVSGSITIDPEQLAVFSGEGDSIGITAKSEAQFVLLAGKPLDEKVVHYGPYVMNSETEILQAIRDYQMGKMGVLIEDY